MEIKNSKKAAQRILKAIKNKENIILYGDSDVDGVVSVIILEETINNLGGEIKTVYFPNEKQDHGLNKQALKHLKKFSPALILVLDSGIGNYDEVKIAKKMGFEIIIIDHHEVLLNKLPEASIIVNPKQKNDNYYFKQLANAGIVYKLSRLLLSPKMTKSLEENFLELVALATLSDMVPEVDENEDFIKKGLISLENTWRPGLRAFFELRISESCNSTRALAQKINSVLNAGVVKNHLNEAYLLLSGLDIDKAKILIQKLIIKNFEKQTKIREMVEEINQRIIGKPEEPIIFEGSSNWSLVGLGSVASKICNQYQKPCFVFKIQAKQSRGSVRVPQGFNAVEAMVNCQCFLKVFGGHALAAGFCFKNENLEKLKNCLIKKCKKNTRVVPV